MFFVTWYKALVNSTSVDGWATIAVLSITVALLLLLMFLFSSRVVIRKVGFYGAFAFLALFVISNVFAYQQKRLLLSHDSAIVISPTVNVKNAPSDGSNDSFVIHEGAKVKITDKSLKGWRNVVLADGREGWLKVSQIEEI